MKLRVFTDGACSGNPGPGGWACLFLFPEAAQIVSSGYRATTNNRMELMAVVEALEQYLDRYWPGGMDFDEIEVSSDSAYVVNAINRQWPERWRDNRWIGSTRRPIKNCDLWKRFLRIKDALLWIGAGLTVTKVEGHAGNEFNEMADRAARAESEKARKLLERERGKGTG